MADFYAGMAEMVTRLINKTGRNFTLRTNVSSGTAYDPTITPTDKTVKGTFVPTNLYKMPGTLIQEGDKRLLIDYAEAVTKDMKVVDDSIVYSIEFVQPIEPGGERLMTILIVRS